MGQAQFELLFKKFKGLLSHRESDEVYLKVSMA